MTPRIFIVSTFAVFVLALPLRVAATDSPCLADVKRLCPNVEPGEGRIQACMQQHAAELSDACRAKIDALVQEVKEIAVVCRFDIGRLCSGVSPGEGKLLSCLNSNAADLSPMCKDELDRAKK